MPDYLAHADPLVEKFEVGRAGAWSDFSLARAARAVGAGERTLERRVRAVLGMSPLSYVRDLRVERAVHQLQTTDSSLDDIAAAVGYGDGVTLRALLRQRTGRGVRELRRLWGPEARQSPDSPSPIARAGLEHGHLLHLVDHAEARRREGDCVAGHADRALPGHVEEAGGDALEHVGRERIEHVELVAVGPVERAGVAAVETHAGQTELPRVLLCPLDVAPVVLDAVTGGLAAQRRDQGRRRPRPEPRS